MDTAHYAHDLNSVNVVEYIALQNRHHSSCEDVEAAQCSEEEEALPRSDSAHLDPHTAYAAQCSGTTLTSNLLRPQTLFGSLQASIMSKTPLMIRPPPDVGTSSYGALAAAAAASSPSSASSQTFDDEVDDVRRRDKRKVWGSSRSTGRAVTSTSTADVGHHQARSSRSRRRTSSATSDFLMAHESKHAHAEARPLSPKTVPGLHGPSHRSSSAGSSTERSSKASTRRRRHADEDPVDNSAYPEVRASVRATDDTTLSISTPRMWTLSLLFAIAGSATNLFFSLRYPSVAITPVIALVLVHPLGKIWDLLLKRDGDAEEIFVDGSRHGYRSDTLSWRSRFRLWLAQGRWNEKEHACVYISSNVSFGFAFATDVIVEQHKFYKQDVPILYQILLTVSTQILGYAFAGLTRRFLVRPAAMIWPGTLMSTAMFTTMHKQDNEPANGWTISRYRFFVYVWAGAFAWYFLPGLLFPALSYFNVITWFAPDNVVVANLVRYQPSLQYLTFDLFG
jgi:OPT oligopeptide transporter protein